MGIFKLVVSQKKRSFRIHVIRKNLSSFNFEEMLMIKTRWFKLLFDNIHNIHFWPFWGSKFILDWVHKFIIILKFGKGSQIYQS